MSYAVKTTTNERSLRRRLPCTTVLPRRTSSPLDCLSVRKPLRPGVDFRYLTQKPFDLIVRQVRKKTRLSAALTKLSSRPGLNYARSLQTPSVVYSTDPAAYLRLARDRNQTTGFSSMRAAGPTARPPHPFFKLRAYPFDMLPPCLILFDGDGPADPLVPRERRYVFPCRSCLRVGRERLSEISRKAMYDSSRDSNRCHRLSR